MLKVFLVEDEFIVREGIKNIDWEENGYEFVGEASDGELAFPLIQKTRPDIVITDIRMPFMDGLTLSRMVKQALPATEILVLTGHEEFEYAKEAIRIGIAEYLSKPISSDRLLAAVDEVAAKIREKRKDEEIIKKYREEMAEDTQKERRQLFADLISADKSALELFESSRELGLELSAVWYNLILVQVKAVKHAHGEYSKRIVQIGQQLHGLENVERQIVFDRNLDGTAILVKADTQEQLHQTVSDCVESMRHIFEKYEHVQYFIGVGDPVNRLRELNICFEQASHAFAHRFLCRDSRILYYKELSPAAASKEEPEVQELDMTHYDRGRMKEFIRTGDASEIRYFVEEFCKNLGTKALESRMFRQYLVMDVYFCVTEFAEELQQSREKIPTVSTTGDNFRGTDAVISYLNEVIACAIELRENVASNRYGDVVQEVKSYIEENYADEELSLNTLASHVNFSPNHLSMIFSQQTGQTFVKYLTEYRMGKAKELLRCSGKRSSVIAQEVGYKDSHYFSYLFKKTQGMTPTQYRGGTA
ncbi:MAG: response regulator [Lachnospiraceae bacterium]|nr:response regulator [Lachnospiraceae bacterium]